MKGNIRISEKKINFDEYFESEHISEKTKKKLDEVDILVVPCCYSHSEYYFAQETVEFVKFCKEFQETNEIDILADDDIKVRSLHSFDIWMPIINVLSIAVLPIALNLVSNYIWEKLKGREHEEAQVEVTFIVRDGTKHKELYYKGDAKAFKDNFEKIDLNGM